MVTDDKEITIADLIFFLKKYFLIICVSPLLISSIAYFVSAFMPKYYSSSISFFSSTGGSGGSVSLPSFVMGVPG